MKRFLFKLSVLSSDLISLEVSHLVKHQSLGNAYKGLRNHQHKLLRDHNRQAKFLANGMQSFHQSEVTGMQPRNSCLIYNLDINQVCTSWSRFYSKYHSLSLLSRNNTHLGKFSVNLLISDFHLKLRFLGYSKLHI